MPELLLHGRTVETYFDLLGRDENDMTYALGWGLTRHEPLLRAFAARVARGVAVTEPVTVELQEFATADGGFTDIELRSPELHIIVEAKRGWDPPSEDQLRRYEERLAARGLGVRRLVILTQNGAEPIVRHLLGSWAPPPPTEAHVLGWADVVDLATEAGREGPLASRRVSSELAAYLREVADMRDLASNRVYVVSLSAQAWPGWQEQLPPIEIVARHGRYFFPATGKNWPKVPPNYIAFRYSGHLQSIHHVDDYVIIDNPYPHLPGALDVLWEMPHFFLTLGPAIRPDHPVPTGKGIVRAARVWVDIDLLLTSPSITEAFQLTRARHGGSPGSTASGTARCSSHSGC